MTNWRAPARLHAGADAPAGRHVLIIVQNLPVPLDRRVWLECQTLRDGGYDVSVVCPKGDGDPAFEVLDGVDIHKYDPPPPAVGAAGFAREFAYCWVQTARLVARIWRRKPFDVIQACNPPDTYFALARLYRSRGVRFVYDQHDLCPELYRAKFERPSRNLTRGLERLERATYRTADHVLATNESFADKARTRGGKAADEVTIVRSGPVASAMRRQAPRPELRRGRRNLAAYLGIMGPQDGVDLLLQAIAHLVHDVGRTDTHFALLGFGDSFDQLTALAGDLGLEEWVEFTGRADDRMIIDYLSTAAVGLAPDPRNGFNELCTMNKVLEYMAFELPVVSFDLDENVVSAGEAGVFVPDNDARAFAVAVDGLLDDPDRGSRMGGIGRRRLESSLDWSRSAAAYLGAYDRLLGVDRNTPRDLPVAWLRPVEPVRAPARAAS